MIKLVYLSGFIWKLVPEKPVPYQKGAGERDKKEGAGVDHERLTCIIKDTINMKSNERRN